jgi:hypothetical protein
MHGIVGNEIAAINPTIAGAVLQGDAPLPAHRMGDGARIRHQIDQTRALHRHRAVAGQPMTPVLIGPAQRLADQQAPLARAVDEQIARHIAPIGQPQHRDIAGQPIAANLDDRPFCAFDTPRLGMGAQKGGIEPASKWKAWGMVGTVWAVIGAPSCIRPPARRCC